MSKQPRPSQGVLNLPIGRRLKGLMVAAARENGQKLSMASAEAMLDWLAAGGFYEPSPDASRFAAAVLSKLDGAKEAQLVLYSNRASFEAQAQAARGMTWEDHNGLITEVARLLKREGIAVRWIAPETTDLSRLHRDGKLGGQN